MTMISGDDQYCRYLSAPGSETSQHQFGKFLDRLGIELPLSLRDIIQYGWITPIFRVRLPTSFYLSWERYPVLSFRGNIAEDDKWAVSLYVRSVTSMPATTKEPGPLTGNWYTHFLDIADHPLTQKVRAHVIPAGLGVEEPAPIQHPHRNQLIYPWIDFFAYWQAYELAEILRASVLFYPIRDTPHAEEQITHLLSHLDDYRAEAQRRIARIKESWAKRRVAYDWISRYRTMLGAWVGTHDSWQEVWEAIPQLLAQLGLAPEDLKEGIRDTLLTLWHDWAPRRGKHVPRLIRLHLQEDIGRAVDFSREATGTEIDLEDAFWGGKDRMGRGWTPLSDALPYETFTAKADFPTQASVYLESWSNLLPRLFSEDGLHHITVNWWPRSVAFRRFCLAFLRLHQFTFSSGEDRLGLRESTPIDFLILCTLHAEKILRDRFLEKQPEGSRSPKFTPLIKQSAETTLRDFKFKAIDVASAIEELTSVLKEKGDLHDLHSNPKNPFVDKSDFSHQEPLVCRVLACFSNFAILRNYVAHHDSLDEQLVEEPMAETVFEALLVVPIAILAS